MGFKDSLSGITSSIKDAAEDAIDYIDDKVDMPDIITDNLIDIKAMKEAGTKVYQTSRETSDLCHTT
eukprot:CAMPEP_0183713812 /NCGR_PEP_ID=MMETSP0737-20130205/8558_1 /TAXON_ID=385413 /ORGANISM="Thalassiosira miniscula, Strain CCMP1093" /LENGTH=66 /DNA_ID=CAMNT_0025942659 /DNA_START=59 /DNA_END=256 /DNA_ORIENTATION=+